MTSIRHSRALALGLGVLVLLVAAGTSVAAQGAAALRQLSMVFPSQEAYFEYWRQAIRPLDETV